MRTFIETCHSIGFDGAYYDVEYAVKYSAFADTDGTVWVDDVSLSVLTITDSSDNVATVNSEPDSAWSRAVKKELGEMSLIDRCRDHFLRSGGNDEDVD